VQQQPAHARQPGQHRDPHKPGLPGLTLGSFSIHLEDGVLALLVAAVVARGLRGARFTGPSAGLVGIAVLAGLACARGLLLHDLAEVLNEARQTLYFLAAALYVASRRATPDLRDWVARCWCGLAGVLVAVAVFRWLIVLAGLPLTGSWYNPDFLGLRVIPSDAALVLTQSFLLLLPAWLTGGLSRGWRRFGVALGACVLVLQHRSVWATLLAGAALVVVQQRQVRRLAVPLGLAAAAALAVSLLFAPGPPPRAALEESPANTDTFEWRVEGWRVLLRDSGPQGPVEALVGRPYGTGWERRLASVGYTTDVAPHNFYVELGLRTGLVGVGLLVLLYARSIMVLTRRADHLLVTVLAVQLLYFVPYAPGIEQGVLLGLALAAVRQRAPTPRAPEAVNI
jgi:hypothetical protein